MESENTFNSKSGTLNAYTNGLQHQANTAGYALNNAVLAAERAHGYSNLTISVPLLGADQVVLNAIRGYNGFSGSDGFGNKLEEYQLATDSSDNLKFSYVNLTKHIASLAWVRVPTKPGVPDYVVNVLYWYGKVSAATGSASADVKDGLFASVQPRKINALSSEVVDKSFLPTSQRTRSRLVLGRMARSLSTTDDWIERYCQ